ncbi:hypothetical protein [Desulfovibrio sp.]|uniref:hypothetical protein n=1 Tax=Desulfovibrio sp. TaxID=885 RepID=UPI003D14A9FA
MHILKDFISIDDLETRWGLDKKQIESFTYERGDEPRLTMWYATEKRARPDGGQSAFVKRAQYLNGCVFDMADVLEIEKLNPELVHAAMAENDEPKMIDGKFVFAEHQIIGKDHLYKRWFGATREEIARHFDKGELRAYEHYKGPINNVIWCNPGQIYYQSRQDYSNPGLYEYLDDQCSYFLLEDVLQCEKLHPEYIGNVSAEDLGLPDDPFKDVPFTKSPPESSGEPLPPVDKTDWRDCNIIQDFESRPKISDSLCRNNLVLAFDADGTTCPPELATLPLKIFFTEMPKPDDGDFYTSNNLMERYKLGPAEFVEYLMQHKDLFPHGVPEWFYIQHHTINERGMWYEYQPMSRKVEELDNFTFHYRTIRNHEKSMHDNGYYDRYDDEYPTKANQSKADANSSARMAELEAQLAEAQKQVENLRQWNKRLNEQNQELRAELATAKEIQPIAVEPATTVNATKWGRSVTAAFGVWSAIIAGDKTDWKEDEFRAALAERCNDYHTDVHAIAWRLLPQAFKHGRGRPKKNPK